MNIAHSGICLVSEAKSAVPRDSLVRIPTNNIEPAGNKLKSGRSENIIQNINMKKTNTTAVATVPIVKKTVFAFKTRPAIAPKGLQNGLFTEVVNETGIENGKEFSRLIVTVELEAKNVKGQPFQVSKTYNIMPNGRGVNAFLNDYNTWSESKLTEDDMYNEFNSDTMIKGKPVVVAIDHRKTGKEWEAFIEAFHPADYTEGVAA